MEIFSSNKTALILDTFKIKKKINPKPFKDLQTFLQNTNPQSTKFSQLKSRVRCLHSPQQHYSSPNSLSLICNTAQSDSSHGCPLWRHGARSLNISLRAPLSFDYRVSLETFSCAGSGRHLNLVEPSDARNQDLLLLLPAAFWCVKLFLTIATADFVIAGGFWSFR